ncbi:MAG: 6-phosphogluconolactonase [Thiotrichaceae bacterium]|nr:6-phosphogluconolactonase [Thiotrichaceae bacterium]
MKINKNNVQVKKTAEEVALFARDYILDAAQEAIRKVGVFKIVLAGGTTPEQVYGLLALESCDWQHWHFYLGDERCLPLHDVERNSEMVRRILLDKKVILEENIHFISAELGAKKAAIDYEKVIKSVLPFDMVLLGMGEDGHTASLFPNHQHSNNEYVHAVFDAPKPPSERVSLSVDALSQNRHLLIMVTGAGKHDAVTQWQKGKNLPVSQISSNGEVHLLLDSLAWSG